MTRLGDADITDQLGGLTGWTRVGEKIERTYDLGSFPGALAFVVRVGFLAEQADHHPDLDIRFKHVRVMLTSHDVGGITERDLALARRIRELGA